MGELLRFALVGVVGYVVDVAALTLVRDALGLGLYLGRVFSFLLAASATWYPNARIPFRVKRLGWRQWAAFLAANSAGAVVNYGVYAALVTWVGPARDHPAIAVACGALSGLLLNFASSRRFVFARRGG